MIEILLIHNCINIRKAYKKLDKTEYKNKIIKFIDKKSYCMHLLHNGNYCLNKSKNSNGLCKLHDPYYIEAKKELDLFNKIEYDNNYYKTYEEYMNNLLIYDNNNIMPSCPTYSDIIPILKPDEKDNKPTNIKTIIRRKRKKKVIKNKVITNNIDFNKINKEIQIFKSNLMKKSNNYIKLSLDSIKLYNNILFSEYKDINEFVRKYKFLLPVDNNNNVIDINEYKNRLLNIDYNAVNGFKGNIVHNYTKKIIDFQLKSYYYIMYNRNKLTNNSIKFINNVINRIPK